ncbi:ATP-binding protein [Streptomyces sp. NPDC006259]|uniref:ATP-binding protein n=1 Tax=Streptomyces sp. NPDC006259 TaxID=3364740 RepID=UPI00367959C2
MHATEAEHTLLGDNPTTAERARQITREFLRGIGPQDSAEVDAVMIVVSELVTNAIQHADGVTGFRLGAAADTLTICVDDASREQPHTRHSHPWEPGGFGWPLVQRLSETVRVDTRPDGKTVRVMLLLAHSPGPAPPHGRTRHGPGQTGSPRGADPCRGRAGPAQDGSERWAVRGLTSPES